MGCGVANDSGSSLRGKKSKKKGSKRSLDKCFCEAKVRYDREALGERGRCQGTAVPKIMFLSPDGFVVNSVSCAEASCKHKNGTSSPRLMDVMYDLSIQAADNPLQ